MRLPPPVRMLLEAQLRRSTATIPVTGAYTYVLMRKQHSRIRITMMYGFRLVGMTFHSKRDDELFCLASNSAVVYMSYNVKVVIYIGTTSIIYINIQMSYVRTPSTLLLSTVCIQVLQQYLVLRLPVFCIISVLRVIVFSEQSLVPSHRPVAWRFRNICLPRHFGGRQWRTFQRYLYS